MRAVEVGEHFHDVGAHDPQAANVEVGQGLVDHARLDVVRPPPAHRIEKAGHQLHRVLPINRRCAGFRFIIKAATPDTYLVRVNGD